MNALIETLNRWGEAAIPLAGQMLWQSSLLIIVLLALDLLLRHHIRAGFRYALWMLLLVKLVLPPSLALPTGAGYWIERPVKAEAPVKPPVAEEASLPAPAVEVNHAADPGIIVEVDFFDHLLAEAMADAPPATTVLEAPTSPVPTTNTPAVQLTWRGQLLAAWFAGMWLLLGWMLWRWRWVNRLVRASEPAPADLKALLADLYRHNVYRTSCPTPSVLPAACRQSGRDRHSVRSGEVDEGATALETNESLTAAATPGGALGETRPTIPVRLTDAAMSPAVCGLFRPVILLPRKLVGKLSREQLGTVLLHELIHLRRRDLWVNCVQTLLQIAAWWHPLLWLANARIRRVREEAVDEAVACALRDDADAYPATLLEVAKLTFTRPLMTLGLVGILESKHALKQRIRRLLELPPLESTRLKWWQWLAVAALALVAVPMAEGQKSVGGAEEGTAQWTVDAAFVLLPSDRATRMLPRPLPDLENDSVRAWVLSAGELSHLKQIVQDEDTSRPLGVAFLPSARSMVSEGQDLVLPVTHQVFGLRAQTDFLPGVNSIGAAIENETRSISQAGLLTEEDMVSSLGVVLHRARDGLRLDVRALSRTENEWRGLPLMEEDPRVKNLSQIRTNFQFATALNLPADTAALVIQPRRTRNSPADSRSGLVLMSLDPQSGEFVEPAIRIDVNGRGQIRWQGESITLEALQQRMITEPNRESWLRFEVDATTVSNAGLMDIMRRLSWAQFWNVSLNPAVWEQAHGSVRFSVRPLSAAEVAPRLAELVSDEILQTAVDALAEPDRALFPTVEMIRPLVGARHRHGAFPLEIAVRHADGKAAVRAALEIAWAYRQSRRNVDLAAEEALRIDDDPDNPRRAGLRIRDITVTAPGSYRVGGQEMSLKAIGTAIREEAARNPRFELVEVRTLDAQGEVITPPKELREALRSAGVRNIARYWGAEDPLSETRTRDQGSLRPQSGTESPVITLSNMLAAAQADFEKATSERSTALERLHISDVWLLDKSVLEHSFVRRHLEELNVNPPAEFLDLDKRYQSARILRDSISMKLAQEKINESLGHHPAPVDLTNVRMVFQQQFDSAERDMERAREEYRALQEKLGPDPLTRPDQTLSKEEFLRLMPVIQASIRLNQSSNRVQSARDRLAEVEARAKGQGSLSPQPTAPTTPKAPDGRVTGEDINALGFDWLRSPPLSLGHTNLTEYGAQMITVETLFPDPRVSGYRLVGLEPRFVLVPVEGLSKALGGQLPLARPLIIASNELAALTNSLIEAGAVNHAFTELVRFSKMSGGVFHWQVAEGEPSQVMFQTADNPVTNAAAASPRQIVFGARHSVPAFAPDWVPLTLLARPFAGDDDTLHSILSLATGEQQPVVLAQAEETIPPGGSLVWASTNEVRAGFAQAVILHNSGPPSEEADESADGAGEAAAKIQNARELIEAGKLDEAEVLLREAAKADPGNSMVSYYFAQINRARQPVDFDRAGLREPLTDGQRKLMEKLNRVTLDRVEFDHVPLVEAVKNLSDESRRRDPQREGITFKIFSTNGAANVGAAIITISPPLSNLRMIDVLNAVVMSADQRIKFTVQDSAVVFSARAPEPEHLQTRVFRLNPNTFDRMKAAHTNAHIPSGAVTNDMSIVNRAVRNHFEAAGVSLLAPKMIYFNERTGLLMIKATLEDLEIIQRAVMKLVREGEPQASPPAEGEGGTGAGDDKKREAAAKVESAGTQRPEALQTRTFQLDPDALYRAMEGVFSKTSSELTPRAERMPAPLGPDPSRGSGGVRFLTVTNDMSVVNVAVRDYFEMVGVKFEPPKMIYFNDRTGMLMVKATLADLEIVQRAVEMLNYEPPQVTLEVRTVEVTKDDVRALGFDWFVANTLGPTTGPLPSLPSTTIAGVLTDLQFRLVMKALEQRANVNIELFPRTTTSSGRQTQLRRSENTNVVSVVTNTDGVPEYRTESVAVGTTVTLSPFVFEDGHTIDLLADVRLVQFLGYDDPVARGLPAQVPLPHFNRQSTRQSMKIRSGDTMVLGGMTTQQLVVAKDKVPVLGDIPLLGRLFRHEEKFMETKHVLVFITPTIIAPAGNRVEVPRQPGQE
jgi:Zn-dependent protease with chaperone function